MKKKMGMFTVLLFTFFLTLTQSTVLAAAPDGSGAWADTVVSANQALRRDGSAVLPERSNPNAALGVAETTGTPSDPNTTSTNFYSLGFGGSITVGFDNAIVNGAGADVMVYEVTGGVYADELINIEASHNGTDWVTLATAVARDEAVDLGILPCAKYVRVTDVSNPNLFEMTADGYDVDGVVALHNGSSCNPQSSLTVDKTANHSQVNPGESVTYTYTVDNTGDFNLDNVMISDDKCSPISGPSGDDGDAVLEMSEVWTYSCTMNLNETTTNVVTVTANDPWDHSVQDTDDYTVTVEALGCTYTQGYWKTHALGSKHADATWSLLPNASTWLSIMNVAPKGNAWYILAHQYVAARLNVLNDAYASPAVTTAIADATTRLGGTTPFVVSAADKPAFISLAGILGSYNEGLTVTPHCAN